jgi:putative tryptophan/tyrosine transport system substrate-binding protein
LRSIPALATAAANPDVEAPLSNRQRAALLLGLQLSLMNARVGGDIETAFAALVQQRVGALLVDGDPLFDSYRNQIGALATRNAIPTMFGGRRFVAAGRLMSCGNEITDSYRRTGIYVGRILKGAKPADLPVMQSTKFEFVINLKTAKALGLTVPPTLLAIADEVIE